MQPNSFIKSFQGSIQLLVHSSTKNWRHLVWWYQRLSNFSKLHLCISVISRLGVTLPKVWSRTRYYRRQQLENWIQVPHFTVVTTILMELVTNSLSVSTTEVWSIHLFSKIKGARRSVSNSRTTPLHSPRTTFLGADLSKILINTAQAGDFTEVTPSSFRFRSLGLIGTMST